MGLLGNNRGTSLVGVMVAAGLSLTMLAAMSQQMLYVSKMNRKQNILVSLFHFKNLLQATVESDQAWAHTLADPQNVNLRCLKYGRNCRNAGGPFILKTSSNEVFYNPLNAQSGLTSQLTPCSGFKASGSASCPFRLNLSWQAICPTRPLAGGGSTPTNACTNPLIRIQGNWLYRGEPLYGGLNLERHRIEFIKTRNFQNVEHLLSQYQQGMNQVNQRLGDLGRRLAALESRPKPQPGVKGEDDQPEPEYFWVNVYSPRVQNMIPRLPKSEIKWYLDRFALRHAETCLAVGALPATNQGYGICASSYVRVTMGEGHLNIFYPDGFGGVPDYRNSGTQAIGGFCFTDSEMKPRSTHISFPRSTHISFPRRVMSDNKWQNFRHYATAYLCKK